MYNPNFDTSLRFEKALELLNKLNEEKLEYDSDSECVLYIYIELNQKAKNWLCNLGVTDFSELEIIDWIGGNKAVDIAPIWSEVAAHYGHDIYYTGEKFIVRDEGKTK